MERDRTWRHPLQLTRNRTQPKVDPSPQHKDRASRAVSPRGAQHLPGHTQSHRQPKGLGDAVPQPGVTGAYTCSPSREKSAVHGHGADFVWKCTKEGLRSGQGRGAARAGAAGCPRHKAQSPEAAQPLAQHSPCWVTGTAQRH